MPEDETCMESARACPWRLEDRLTTLVGMDFPTMPRNMVTVIFSLVWLATDAVVIYQANNDTVLFLTGQVWIFSLVVRFAVVVVAMLEAHGKDTDSTYSRITGPMWLVVGAAQWGVMITFFLLLIIDSGPMHHFIHVKNYSETEIMIWNHARHVTPVFLHALLSWEHQSWVRFTTRTENLARPSRLTVWGLLLIPATIGGVHLAAFNDQNMYHYDESRTTTWCAICFAVSSLVMGMYLVHIGTDRNPPKEGRWLAMPTGASKAAYHVVDANECPPLRF